MARPRDPLRAQKRPPTPARTEQAQAPRRSERISKLQRCLSERRPEKSHASSTAQEVHVPSLPNPQSHPLPLPTKRLEHFRKADDPTDGVPIERPQKRLRPSPSGLSHKQTVNRLSTSQKDHINHWAHQGQLWPKEYFRDGMGHIFRKKASAASLRRKRSDPSFLDSTTASDQKPREEKSAPYRRPGYETLLQIQGGLYMDESKQGISDASKTLCRSLLERKYTTPENTIFGDGTFDKVCWKLHNKNEARIIQDITRLLVPSAETLTIFGDKRLAILVESVNEGWNNCIPVTNPRPQPDYSVGFGQSAFSDDQLSKLGHLVGDPDDMSYFMTTYYMHFPFLTCEVECGTTSLNIADLKNAHSMAIAIRGIVELFKVGKKENDLHRELLTFSISHDDRAVRLYGYYPIIDGHKVAYNRHLIHSFDITALDGKEKWTTYHFTVGVYLYSLNLIERMRAVIDDLPPDFNVEDFQDSEPEISEHSGLSQQFGNQVVMPTLQEQDSESANGDSGPITPDMSMQSKPRNKKTKRP